MCCQLQRQTALVNAQSELAQLFIKFPLEWFLAGNELRSEPVLFVRRSNFWHFCSSRGFWSYPNVLNMVYCLIQSWKKALCFPACWCIRLWACTLFDVHSMNNSFCFLRTKTQKSVRHRRPATWLKTLRFSPGGEGCTFQHDSGCQRDAGLAQTNCNPWPNESLFILRVIKSEPQCTACPVKSIFCGLWQVIGG